jgi:hypothetical protein
MSYDDIYKRTKKLFENLPCEELKSIEQEIISEIDSVIIHKNKKEFISMLNAICTIIELKCIDKNS